MKKLLYLSLVAISLFLMACPYEGSVELSTYEESYKIDKKLIGEWVAFHEEGGREELVMEKLAKSKSVFTVYHKQFGAKNNLREKFKYRVYATGIGGYDIFNIKNKENEFLYCKYGWTGKNEFYIQFIDADFVKNNFKVDSVTTENFNAFVTENVNKEDMYDDKLEFYRKNSPEYEKVRMFMRKSGF
jgi:hypothetical protein